MRLSRGGYWEAGLIVLPFALFAAIAIVPILQLPTHAMLGYNEGWNAYYAQAAMTGGDLYPPPQALVGNNYPPLSFFVVGLLGRLLGTDDVVAGRLLALASLVVVAINVFGLGRRIGADRPAAALGAGMFLVLFAIMTPDYIGEDDPQMFGHALITSGAMVFLRGGATLPRMALAAGLVVAGGLTKHNLVALPLALCGWATLHDRRGLGLFAAAGAVLGLAAAGLLHALWGSAVFDAVLHARRTIGWERLALFAEAALTRKMLGPFIVLACAACVLLRRSPAGHLLALYLFAAAAVGFAMLAGAGVNFNVLDDLCIALSLGAAAAVTLARRAEAHLPASVATPRRVLMLAIATMLLLQVNGFLRAHPDRYDAIWAKAGTTDELVKVLAGAQGPVVCENLVICFWAGKPQEIDFFHYGQTLVLGLTTDDEFRRRIARRDYAYVTLAAPTPDNPMWPHVVPAVAATWIRAHYAAVGRYGDQVLLAPAEPPPPRQ